ncbi:unnamed protein product, partial [marine sediment metagenome]
LDGGSVTNASTETGNVTSITGLEYLVDAPSTAGANILYQYGKTGTIWDESGARALQDGTGGEAETSLWPFPNEDVIKTFFSVPNSSAGYTPSTNDTTRGFCTTGNQLDGSTEVTLTSYIWEYLGNEIPEDIYNLAATPINSGMIKAGTVN